MDPLEMIVEKNKQLIVKEENYQLIAKNLYKLGAMEY
jgi:hypothetical protein